MGNITKIHDLEGEIWKEIPGFNNRYYFVSNLGRVKSLYEYKSGEVKERLKSMTIDAKNRHYVTLCKDDINNKIRISHLVAKTFIPNPTESITVRHKNNNPLDNRAINLEWLEKYKIFCCPNCKKEFRKEGNVSRHRMKKLNQSEFFCGQHCRAIYLDDLSPFRKLFIQVKSKAKRHKIEFQIKLEDIKFLWDKQNGRCSYTGIKMKTFFLHDKANKIPIQMSIDRIDSNKGYTKDNIELVCLFINYGKSDFSKESIINFIKETRGNGVISS